MRATEENPPDSRKGFSNPSLYFLSRSIVLNGTINSIYFARKGGATVITGDVEAVQVEDLPSEEYPVMGWDGDDSPYMPARTIRTSGLGKALGNITVLMSDHSVTWSMKDGEGLMMKSYTVDVMMRCNYGERM